MHHGLSFEWLLVERGERPTEPDERAVDFLAKRGSNFARIPTN
jgi:hypothetical protein